MRTESKQVTVAEVKKYCKENNISFEKENFTLNSNDTYRINGKLYTKNEMKMSFLLGDL